MSMFHRLAALFRGRRFAWTPALDRDQARLVALMAHRTS